MPPIMGDWPQRTPLPDRVGLSALARQGVVHPGVPGSAVLETSGR